MIFIGVTGGIGSGKSLVCALFEKKNIPIFDADTVAKEIPSKRPDILKKIADTFGNETVDVEAKEVRTKILAEQVFADHEKLEKLNSIIHPVVFLEFDRWKKTVDPAAPYALAEAAVLFESGMDFLVDYTLGLTANEKIRKQRVIIRDHITAEQYMQRAQHQLSPEELEQESDFIIANEGTIEELQTKVDFFHTLFLTLKTREEKE